MTSFTACRLHKPTLLFGETGIALRVSRWPRVIGGTAEQPESAVGVEFSEFLAMNALQVLARELPCLDPPPAECDLLRCPIG
jgi:hypothetical protein